MEDVFVFRDFDSEVVGWFSEPGSTGFRSKS